MSETSAVPTPQRGTMRASLSLEQIEARVTEAFGDVRAESGRDELTFFAPTSVLVELLTFCRDDEHRADVLRAHLGARRAADLLP